MAKFLVVDPVECLGCASCVELCPEVFEMVSGAQYAEVIVPESTDECVETAIDTCPVDCIYWVER